MKRAARARPASSVWASVKISSNWSKIRSGMSVWPDSSRSTSSRWCRNSHSDSPAVGDARLGPLAGVAGRLQDRLLDLLAGLRRVGGVGDAHVDRAVALAAQARHQAGAQDRGLAEPRLAEQHGEELALHAARELGDFLVAAEEEAARVLGERGEAEPRMARRRPPQGRCPGLRVHDGRARVKSFRRAANSGVTAPPGSCVKCSALKRSGTSASAALVSSIVTGSTNSAPSAMLRARSIA